MDQQRNTNLPSSLRVHIIYGVAQGAYWMGSCILTSFMTIYLTYRGLSDAQIGLTSSLMAVAAIVLQYAVAGYADKRPRRIKAVVSFFYLLSIVSCAILYFFPLSTSFIAALYIIACGANTSALGFVNAQAMQCVSAGIHINYPLTRAVGSGMYAISSISMGAIIGRYSTDLLMPIFIVIAIIAIASAIAMPTLSPIAGKSKSATKTLAGSSVFSVLCSNKILAMFLLAATVMFIGFQSQILFMIRLVERLNGGSAEYGIAMLIRGLAEIPTLLVLSFVLKKIKPVYLLVICFSAYAIQSFFTLAAPTISFFYCAMGLSVLTNGLYYSASVLFANEIAKPGEEVRTQSLANSVLSVSTIIAGVLAGAVLNTFGLSALFFGGASVCACGAGLMIICAVMYKKEGTAIAQIQQ